MIAGAEAGTLRYAILRAALDLFREKGYHSTSLQDIIAAAGCSKGAFYHHFDGKDDLLCLIHDVFISHELERGEAVLRRDAPAAERLRSLMVDLVESIALYQAEVTVFFEERRFLSSEKFAAVKAKRDRYEEIVRQLVVAGVEAGEFRSDLDLRLVSFGLFGMCNWMYQWYAPGRGASARAIAETFGRLVLEGLQRPKGSVRKRRAAVRSRR